MSWIKHVDPRHWRTLKRAYYRLRAMFFTSSTERRTLRVEEDIDAVRRVLGREYFTNSWELSYRYEGEDLNMRRPKYIDDEYEWYQTHVRGFAQDDGSTLLETHQELEPTAWPYEHLHNVNFSVSDSMDDVCDVLDEYGFEYERLR